MMPLLGMMPLPGMMPFHSAGVDARCFAVPAAAA